MKGRKFQSPIFWTECRNFLEISETVFGQSGLNFGIVFGLFLDSSG